MRSPALARKGPGKRPLIVTAEYPTSYPREVRRKNGPHPLSTTKEPSDSTSSAPDRPLYNPAPRSAPATTSEWYRYSPARLGVNSIRRLECGGTTPQAISCPCQRICSVVSVSLLTSTHTRCPTAARSTGPGN